MKRYDWKNHNVMLKILQGWLFVSLNDRLKGQQQYIRIVTFNEISFNIIFLCVQTCDFYLLRPKISQNYEIPFLEFTIYFYRCFFYCRCDTIYFLISLRCTLQCFVFKSYPGPHFRLLPALRLKSSQFFKNVHIWNSLIISMLIVATFKNQCSSAASNLFCLCFHAKMVEDYLARSILVRQVPSIKQIKFQTTIHCCKLK